MNGKGSDRRPMQIDKKTFEDNWERAFGKKKTKKMLKKINQVKSNWIYGQPIIVYTGSQ